MSDEYQMRNDIDRLMALVDDLEFILNESGVESLGEFLEKYYDKSEVDIDNLKFRNDLTGFSSDLDKFEGDLDKFSGDLTGFQTDLDKMDNDLDDFKGDLDKFEGDLDKFDGDLDNFKTDLDKFDGDLTGFQTDLTRFQTDLNALDSNLTSLNSSLDDLSLDLYGDNTHDGFVDYLNQLQVMLYGKGQTYTVNGVRHNCSINDPCPTSLKGLLNTLQTSNNELKQDNDKLKESLYALTVGLTSFSMTLNEFKAELTRNNINYSELDDGITTLLELIFNAQGRIDNVNGRVDTVNTNITAANNRIDATNTVVNTVSGKATDIEKELYAGANGTGTKNNPANGTVKKNLSNAQGTIEDVQDEIGDANTPGTMLYHIDTLQTDIGDEQTAGSIKHGIKTLQDDIGDEDDPDSIKGGIAVIKDDIGDEDDPDSIKGGIAVIKDDIGDEDDPDSIKGNISGLLDDIGDSNTPNTIKGDINTTKSDIVDVQTDIGNVDVTNNGNLQQQIDNLKYYNITPKVYVSNMTGEIYSTTFQLGVNERLFFYVEGFTRTGTQLTPARMTATLFTPTGSTTLTGTKLSNNKTYKFEYIPTKQGIHTLVIGDSTCSCIVTDNRFAQSIADSLDWETFVSDSNYDVYYNDYFVCLDLHIQNASASTSWVEWGSDVLNSDLRPHMPVVFDDGGYNVKFKVTDQSNKVSRVSMSGSTINGSFYASTMWRRTS